MLVVIASSDKSGFFVFFFCLFFLFLSLFLYTLHFFLHSVIWANLHFETHLNIIIFWNIVIFITSFKFILILLILPASHSGTIGQFLKTKMEVQRWMNEFFFVDSAIEDLVWECQFSVRTRQKTKNKTNKNTLIMTICEYSRRSKNDDLWHWRSSDKLCLSMGHLVTWQRI